MRTLLTIEEIEGAERWKVTLTGRAMPLMKDTPPSFGVMPRGEITKYRGLPVSRAEPLGLDFPPIEFSGRWRLLYFRTGDAAVILEGASGGRPTSTPVEAAQMMTRFAARSKTCRVTWTGGFSRIATWVSGEFIAKPWRSDLEWTLKMPVLALNEQPVVDLPEVRTPAKDLASQRTVAMMLDLALADWPSGLNQGFVEQIHAAFGNVRQALTSVRTAVASIADFARAPASVLSDLTTTLEMARDVTTQARDTFAAVPIEYQVQGQRTENLLAARTWRDDVATASNAAIDELIALLDVVDANGKRIAQYVAVKPGDSLVRVAQRVYGLAQGDLWAQIAAANGIVGQVVPGDTTQLVLPEL